MLQCHLNNTIVVPSVTNFTYSWDANKRKTAEADGIVPPVNSQTFGYDNEDRLTSFNRQNGDSQTWNLSLVGDWNTFNANGTAQTRTHNSVHELTAINGTPLNYDVKGNLTQNSNAQTYVWDYENRMSSANSGATTLGAYKYDALGRRVSKVAGTITTVYVNDGLQEICEYDNGAVVGSPSRSYVFGSYIDEPLMMVNGGVKTYYHTNNLYSVAALTNAAGAVVERYTYDPYGKVKILAPDGVTVRTASAVGNPWTFTGRRLDAEMGLMFFRERYYDVTQGRFINRDPWMANIDNQHTDGIYYGKLPDAYDGFPNGYNYYAAFFVPNAIDPLGLFSSDNHRQITQEGLCQLGCIKTHSRRKIADSRSKDLGEFHPCPMLLSCPQRRFGTRLWRILPNALNNSSPMPGMV